jgi:uncharacterized protein (DUF1330 family)
VSEKTPNSMASTGAPEATGAPIAPSVPFSPTTGPGLIALDGALSDVTLASLQTLLGTSSLIGPQPIRQLEGSVHPHRRLALLRFKDLAAAQHSMASPGVNTLLAELAPTDRQARVALGHHALGDDAPPAANERDKSYLVVHGFISNRQVYGAYLRGLKESNLLVTHSCQRILMMGPSNVRQTMTGPFIDGEYFEVLAFPSPQHIEAFWLSAAYAELITLRQGAVDVFAAIYPAG